MTTVSLKAVILVGNVSDPILTALTVGSIILNIIEPVSVNDSKQLNTQMELLSKEENRIKSGLTAREYISSHTGATKSFLDYIYKNGFN